MKRAEAEQLLGGHATGTLSEAERRALFAAALEDQAIFDALADQEALRELLSDPAARERLLAALAPRKVVPFWRRPGLLGAAAGLMVAATAGLAYLRSPGRVPPLRPESPAPAAVEAQPVPAPPEAPIRLAAPEAQRPRALPPPAPEPPRPVAPATLSAPPPPPPVSEAPVAVREEATRQRAEAESRRLEAQDHAAKKAARPAPAALMEVLSSAPAPKAKAPQATGGLAANPPAPAWRLEPQPGGLIRVVVTAPRGLQAYLLRRGPAGVEVLALQAEGEAPGSAGSWIGQVRLGAGDVLDLYLLKAAVADPARLPETGPLDGFRARIHPAAEK